ncbi:MAG: HIT family protein, partial [Paludibacteraceae bacterium]|nr:HIT family protein [Paludibacteraceae bacterium]
IGLHLFAKKVVAAVEKAIPCKRIGEVVLGLEVPHTHIHLIPLNQESDVDIKNPMLKLTAEDMNQIAASIAKNF